MGLTSHLGGTRRIFFLSISSLLILLLLPFLFAHFRKAQASPNRSDSIVRVERKRFSQTLRLNGTTLAARSFAVLAPRLEGAQVGSMVVTRLAPAGLPIKKDDLLVEFDPQAQMKDYLDKKSTFDNLVSQVAQKRGEEDVARAKDDTAMKQAEDELKRAQLELQRNEIVSRIDAEKNQEAADEAQTTFKQLKETYQLKRTAAAAAIRILEIQRDRAQEAMRYTQGNASKMTVHSPMDGVVVYNTIWLGGRMGTVQQGDQVRPGLRAKMHLDAYPGIELAATLEDLSPLGHPGQFTETVRTFTARFSIQGTDPRLLPDLSAALDLDLGAQENALVVPCQSVGTESGNAFVWVQSSGSPEKRAVKTGPRNDTEVVILSGLQEVELVRRSASGESPSGENQ